MNMNQFSNTAVYPPTFYSQPQNFGNDNDIEMLDSNDIPPPSVYGSSSFFQDSQVTNDQQHFGSFAPLSNIDQIPPFLNYLHPPGLLPSTDTPSATVKEINMAKQLSPFSFHRKIFPAENTATVNEINMAQQQPARFSFSQNRFPAQNTQNERKHTINSENDPIIGNSDSTRIEESKRKKAAVSVEDRRHPHSEERRVLQIQAQTKRQKSVPVKKSQKIGDKVTALQKLVSPFGKTDTASVLKEAAGHIKLLHDQIQMLSTPYFRAGPSRFLLRPQGAKEGNDDLRSRGLCLVPVSFTQNMVKDEKLDSLTLRAGLIARNL